MSMTDDIKALRDRTGISIMQCKEALEKAGGDMDKAVELLKEAGTRVAAKKADRELGAGVVSSYIHGGGSVGAMLELLCETDFVAKNEDFVALGKDLAMQLAATEDEVVEQGVEEFLKQAYIKDPSQTVGDLVQGAIQKFGERTEIGKIVKMSI